MGIALGVIVECSSWKKPPFVFAGLSKHFCHSQETGRMRAVVPQKAGFVRIVAYDIGIVEASVTNQRSFPLSHIVDLKGYFPSVVHVGRRLENVISQERKKKKEKNLLILTI